MTFQTQAQ